MNKINNPKKQSKIALKKAQTSLKNIIEMIDEDKYCIDIMHQLLAVNGLINSASNNLLKNHMNHCFKHGMESDDPKNKEKMIKEILEVVKLSGKVK